MPYYKYLILGRFVPSIFLYACWWQYLSWSVTVRWLRKEERYNRRRLVTYIKNMNLPRFLIDILSMWEIALPAMFIGCFCGALFRTDRFFTVISKITAPMVKFGKLPNSLGPFFILCLLNRYAANAMLAEHYKDGIINFRVLISTYLMGTFPTGIYFTIFNFSPILISNLGWKLGCLFIVINLTLSLLMTIIGFLLNRFFDAQKIILKFVILNL